MLEEMEILKLICNRLEDNNISYMLTGSWAANFYAVPRMTRDIDIVIQILDVDVSKFVQIFPENEFYVPENSITEAIKHENMFNIIHLESVYKIDFVIKKNNLYRTTEFERKRRIEFDKSPIWIVAPEDLIISKLLWSKDTLSEQNLSQ